MFFVTTDILMHTNDVCLFVSGFHLCLGVNPYCMGETDFPMTKKSASPTDRQPYSLCSNRKSLSQQLDYPVSVKWRGGAWRCGGIRGCVISAVVPFCPHTAQSLLSGLKHPTRQTSFRKPYLPAPPPLCQVQVTSVTSMLLRAHGDSLTPSSPALN